MSDANNKSWRCTVCGYIHQGSAPPDICPVCGSPSDAFEAYEAQQKPAATKQVQSWKCLNCGYIHSGPEPPDTCPVCGVGKDSFEPLSRESQDSIQAQQVEHVVVVGAGIAGLSAVESIRMKSPDTNITLISKEPAPPYYRLNLTRYLAGEIDDSQLPVKSRGWFSDNNIDLLLDTEVTKLQLDDKRVEVQHTNNLSFDKLILTVGAHPFMPAFPGAYREGVTNLRTVADAQIILENHVKGKQCVCIGGGLLGLETAGALARQGANVTLLEGHGWLLPRQLNKEAGRMLAEHVKNTGINLKEKARTRELLGDERVCSVLLEDESIVDAELVIVATGIRSNSYLGRMAGLDVNKGIVVDNLLVTSHPDVLAAGDVAEHHGFVYGTWGPSQYQGSIAGMNAIGAGVEFGGIPRSNALKVLNVELFSIGQIEPKDASYQTIDQEKDGHYYRFVFRDSHLVGAILLGSAKLSTKVKKAVERKSDFSRLLVKHPNAFEVIDYITNEII